MGTCLSSLLILDLDSLLKTTWSHSVAIQSCRVFHYSKRRRRWVGVIGSTRNGCRDNRCTSSRQLAMVREDTVVLSEGATGVWTAANDAVASTRASRMI
ncbi:uncharacterized protein TNCV_1863731 [Trichonephila clavipes]|nr:uncharacterized protein TNCV_1863731 [Trichonephila clavipes]